MVLTEIPEFESGDITGVEYETRRFDTIASFAHHSSIHGVRYLADDPKSRHRSIRQRDSIDKIVWALALLVSFVCFGWLFLRICMRSSIVVGVAEHPQPIWNIPFPAITICPENKVKGTIFNFTRTYHEISAANGSLDGLDVETARRMEAISLICDAHITEFFKLNTKVASLNLMETMKELAPTTDAQIMTCKQRSKVLDDCNQLFSDVWTEEGLCFTSNSLNSKELYTDKIAPAIAPIDHQRSAEQHWRPDNGYTVHPSEPAYPERAHSAGARGGLMVVLLANEQYFDYLCRGPNMGFKVVLHAPHESPMVSRHFFRVSLSQDTKITIRPDVSETSEDLRSISPNERYCYFEGEKRLQFFRAYSQRNCELECMSEYFLKECGCTRFSMPRNSTAPVCAAASISCLEKAEEAHLDKNQMDGLSPSAAAGDNSCNCLPSCANIEYNVDVSQSALDWKQVFDAHKSPLAEVEGLHLSRLSFVFKHNQYTSTKRYELYGTTDALALAGGLLSLFFGASLLSLFEIVYVFVVRKVVKIRR